MSNPLRALTAALAAALALTALACQPNQWAYEQPELGDRLGPTQLQQDKPVDAEHRARAQAARPAIDGPVPPEPAGPLRISVEQAVFTALSNNRELNVRQLDPAIVGTFEQLERARFDPAWFLSAEYLRQETVSGFGGQVDPFPLEIDSVQARTGLRQTLPTGTDIEAAVSHQYQEATRFPDAGAQTSTEHDFRVGLTVTQALLRGGGRAANLAAVQQAALDMRISQYELRGFTQALVAEVEITYWQFALARQEVEILEQGLDVAERQQQETQQRVEVGVLPRTELAAARAEVASRRQLLIDARSRTESLRLELLRLVNPASARQWDRQIEILDTPTVPDVVVEDPGEHVRLARQLRPEVSEAQLRLERDRLEVVQTRRGLMPRLDVFATLGKSGFSDSLGRAIEDIDSDLYDAGIGVELEVPLGNRAARAQHEAATATRYQAALAIQNLTQTIETDVRSALIEVERTRQQIDATAATRQLREQTLNAEQERFEVGQSTALLVAQAQRDLLESQLDEAAAVIGFRVALIDLYRLEGSLLHRRGIAAPGETRFVAEDFQHAEF